MEKRKLEKFPAGVLERIAIVMGDNMTGSEIARLIRQAGYPDKSQVLGTKWRFLFALFDELNTAVDGQYHVAKII